MDITAAIITKVRLFHLDTDSVVFHFHRVCFKVNIDWLRQCLSIADVKTTSVILKEMPFYSVVAPISLAFIIIFFVKLSDSGSRVIDTITAGGKMDAPVTQRVFWCTLKGLVAIALLLLVGG